MADNLLVTKADFTAANLVKFSQNINEDQLAPYIQAAQEYELEPRLGELLYTDLLGAVAADPSRPELVAFLNTKVKRYLVLIAYKRFISAHGLNVTQFGLTKTGDPQGTFSQAEAQERAVIIRQIASDSDVALIKMLAKPLLFDGVNYTKTPAGGVPSPSIRAPKRTLNFRPSLLSSGSLYSDLTNGTD